MRRAQISVEYMMIFSVALLVFIIIGVVISSQLDDAQDNEQTAERVLNQIKLHTITASTSNVNYNATLAQPRSINGEPITLTIHPDPDSIAIIESDLSGAVLASIQLPTIDEVDASGPDDELTIRRVGDEVKAII